MVSVLSSADCAWDALDWKGIHYRVRKIQKRIARAAASKDWHAVSELQKMVYHSYECRLLAVHRVTTQKNTRTPGLDGKFWRTDEERYAAVDSLLDLERYCPKPFKRFLVPKDHDRTKKRPLSVPVIYDRAVQGLVLIGLDPVVEVLADKHAYGFRCNRSAYDTIYDIVTYLGFGEGRQWFLRTDVKECFDHISHDWLLRHTPMDKKLLKTILTCGYISKDGFFPTTEGVPQGGVLSPVITTLALSGFEKIVQMQFPDVRMVRFADDFIFAAENREILLTVLEGFKEFLSERGLSVSEQKTHVEHISRGFDFIGWNIISLRGVLHLTPSEQSVQELKTYIQNILRQGRKWTCRRLVLKLNDVISGWTQYHVYLCSQEVFANLDDWIANELWQWAIQRHPKHTAKWIYEHYWIKSGGRRTFTTGDEKLLRFADITIRVSEPLDLTKNPYLDVQYFRTRQKEKYGYKKKGR